MFALLFPEMKEIQDLLTSYKNISRGSITFDYIKFIKLERKEFSYSEWFGVGWRHLLGLDVKKVLDGKSYMISSSLAYNKGTSTYILALGFCSTGGGGATTSDLGGSISSWK